MAELPQNNIEVFLRNIPGQISEARHQLFSENINCIEFVQERLEDSTKYDNFVSLLNVCVYLIIEYNYN